MSKKTSNYYLGKAEKAGCEIKQGSKHTKIYCPAGKSLPANFPNPLTIPHDLKGNGTEHAIVKWLAALGIFLVLVLVFIH